MSFSENPYVHLDVVTAPPPSAADYLSPREREIWADPERVYVRCDGCGAQDVAQGSVTINSPISAARDAFRSHVRRSHGRAVEDFQGWGWE